MKTIQVPARELRLENVPTGDLKALPGHARISSQKQIRKIRALISELGFLNPMLADDSKNIICGHNRLKAAQQLGMKEVPVLRVSGLTPTQLRAYRIAENRLGELGEWDDDLLAEEFEFLLGEGFDVELTGFDMSEVDALLTRQTGPGVEEVELPGDGPIISRIGDAWEVAGHRLICGDSRDPSVYQRLMQGERAQMVFTDPPYNVQVGGNVAGIRTNKHREFGMGSGEMTPVQFTELLRSSLGAMASACSPGAIIFACMDWRHVGEMLAAGAAVGLEHKQLIVWTKTNWGMGSFYRSQHELIFVFKVPGAEHINNFGLGMKGRCRTNVWTYAGANGFRKGRSADLADHPTVKPTAMVADAIKDCSKRRGIILDGFVGSGTSLVAAERTGRRGFGIEIDPAFVDVALRRLEEETGQEPVHESGATFSEIAAGRLEKEAA